MPYKHRQQQLQYQRDHYLKNKEEYRSRWSRQRIANKEYVDLIKEKSSCSLCREERSACLDFHHLRDKDKKISRAIKDWSLERLKEEIEKCELICSNCHRKHHFDDVISTTNNKKRIKNREYIKEYKEQSGGCDCGEMDIRCLDFHHTEKKDATISKGICDWGLERLKEEVKKCELVCSNCHKILHNYQPDS